MTGLIEATASDLEDTIMADEQDQATNEEGPIKPGGLLSASKLNAEFKRLQRQIDELRQRLETLEGRQAKADEGPIET